MRFRCAPSYQQAPNALTCLTLLLHFLCAGHRACRRLPCPCRPCHCYIIPCHSKCHCPFESCSLHLVFCVLPPSQILAVFSGGQFSLPHLAPHHSVGTHLMCPQPYVQSLGAGMTNLFRTGDVGARAVPAGLQPVLSCGQSKHLISAGPKCIDMPD
jgi:hypothetical protein